MWGEISVYTIAYVSSMSIPWSKWWQMSPRKLKSVWSLLYIWH